MTRPILTPIEGIGIGIIATAALQDGAVTSAKVAADTLTDADMSAANKLSAAWITPALATGWSNAGGLATVQVTKHGNVLFIAGSAQYNGGGTDVLTTTAVGNRPAVNTRSFAHSSGGGAVRVTWGSDGQVAIQNAQSGQVYSFTLLAAAP